jgi:large subunit ribosomal protein L23
MSKAHEIIIRPLITERSTGEAGSGRYTFIVAEGATKTEIRRACEELFSVKVVKVNTSNHSGKSKRVGVHQGMTPSWKKAVVTIDTEPKAMEYLAKGGRTSPVSRKFKTTIEEFGFGQ